MNLMAEDEGFEPPQTESESGVLPLHKSSICDGYIICNNSQKSSVIFDFFKKLFSLVGLPFLAIGGMIDTLCAQRWKGR